MKAFTLLAFSAICCTLPLFQGCAVIGGAAALSSIPTSTVLASGTAGYFYMKDQVHNAQQTQDPNNQETKAPWDHISAWFKKYQSS